MNPLQLSAQYLKGYGGRRGIQEAVDYGLGAAIGAGGQQLMNWTTQGADPNPLLSGALFAPVGAGLVRGGRLLKQSLSPEAYELEPAVVERLFAPNANRLFDATPIGRNPNPYAQAALLGSLAGMAGGAGTSIYNTVTGGDDVDNNLIAGGLALLGGVAPITYSMIRGRGNTMASEPIGTSRNPVNSKTGYYGSVGTSHPFDIGNAPGYSGEIIREDRLLDRLFNRSK